MTSSAAASAFRVSSPSDGGQSINTKSYHSFTARRASRSLCSRDGTPTSSTSAPARWILDGARSSPFTGDGISAEAIATPLMRTSYSEVPTDARETPTPLVACACGSLSTSKTCVPERARAADTLTAGVDFPPDPRALEQNGLPAHAHEGEGQFTQGREWGHRPSYNNVKLLPQLRFVRGFFCSRALNLDG